jgi:hypothetical protein
MPRFLIAALTALLLVPAAAASAKPLPKAHPIDLSKVHYGADPGLPDPNAVRHIPGWLRSWSKSDVHAAADYPGPVAKEEQYQDEHGHVLTLGTDNPAVDLQPFANLLASTYHGDEIERIKVFVTDTATLEAFCGGDAVACYAGDSGSPDGVMVISYMSDNIIHAVIHEYGHHIDNNTFNFAGLHNCGIDGDGSRLWFLARERRDRITRHLTCNPDADWGHLYPEVYAEDYAQMVGIPRSDYHPAISVAPPSGAMLAAIKQDIDVRFAPTTQKIKGRSGSDRTASGKLKLGFPVFLSARKAHGVAGIGVSGCGYRGVKDVYFGTCKVTVKTKRARQKFSFTLVKR